MLFLLSVLLEKHMKEYQAKSTTQVRQGKDSLYRSIIHYESALLQNHFLEKEVKNFFDK